MENTFFFLGLKRNCEQFVPPIALTIPHCQSKLLDRVSLEEKDTTQLFADFFIICFYLADAFVIQNMLFV